EFALPFRGPDQYRKSGLRRCSDYRLQQDLVRDVEMAEGRALGLQPCQNVAQGFRARVLLNLNCRHCCSLSLRYRRIRVLVELSWLSTGSAGLSSSGIMRCARTLPSSTPH